MRPLPELVGQIAMSSNKTNAENNKTDGNKPQEDEDQEKQEEGIDNGGDENAEE